MIVVPGPSDLWTQSCSRCPDVSGKPAPEFEVLDHTGYIVPVGVPDGRAGPGPRSVSISRADGRPERPDGNSRRRLGPVLVRAV